MFWSHFYDRYWNFNNEKFVKLLEKAREMDISEEGIKSLVQGRDLILLGMKPSKEFKIILDFALDLQIDKDLEKAEIIQKIKEKYL